MKYFSSKMICAFFATFLLIGALFTVGRFDPSIKAKELKTKLSDFSYYVRDINAEGTPHLSRLKEYDGEMNAIGYLNEDGSKSVYIFDSDVKYIDEEGFIVEKNTKIVPNTTKDGYCFSQEANDIQTYFVGESSQLKYMVCYGQYELTVAPIVNEREDGPYEITVSNTGNGINAENSITYNGVYGDNTYVKFTAGLSGVKEEIVYTEAIDVEELRFILFTGELEAKQSGRAVLLNDYQNNTVFVLPSIVIYDSSKDGINFSVDSQIELEMIEEGKYELTVVPDADFLTNENTVYPVYIDPTVTISNSQDAVVYSASNKAGNNHGYDSINMVGYSTENGYGYFYSKLNLSAINSIRFDNILSACFCIREISGTTNADIIEAHMVSESWNEGTITWNGKPSNLSQKLTSCKLQYDASQYSDNNWYSFYITQACMGWRQGLNNYGIVLKPKDETVYKAFASREYSSGYTPYWKITYIDESEVTEGLGVEHTRYYIKNKNTKKYLTNSILDGLIAADFTGGIEQQWTLVPVDATYWKICPYTYTSQGIGVSGYDGSGNGLIVGFYSSSASQMWKITRNWNGTYKFQSKASLGNNHSYAITENNSQISIYNYNLDYIFDQDWTLEPVDLGVAEFFTQISAIASSVLEEAEDAGFEAYGHKLPYTAMDLFDWIVSDRLVVTDSFGGCDVLQIGDTGFTPYTFFRGVKPSIPANSSVYVSDYDPNELNHLNCLIYYSSNSGATDYTANSNLVGITYKRGVHFTMSWTITIWGSSFTKDFMNQIKGGKSVYEAMESAVNSNQGYNGLWNYHYLGDTDIVFNHVIEQ